MSAMSNMVYEIQEDLEQGVLSFAEIARKYDLSVDDITMFAREFGEQMEDLQT